MVSSIAATQATLPDDWTGANPYGKSILPEEITETFSFFDDWEDRYRYVIDLGKELPPMPEAMRTEERRVHGCQSMVWIAHELTVDSDGSARLKFMVDSDAHIVRGLIALVLAQYYNRTCTEILETDIEQWFGELDLLNHLSPTRGNGLRAMIARIQQIAAAVAAATP